MLTDAQRAAVSTRIAGDATMSAMANVADDAGIAALYNAPGSGGTLRQAVVTKQAFLFGIRSSLLRLPALSAAVQAKWDRVRGDIRAADDGVTLDAGTLVLLGQAVADGLLTQPEADAIGVRPCTLAEADCGEGFVLSAADAGSAR